MNKKVYLCDLEWTNLKRGYYINEKPDFLGKGGVKATIVFNDAIPYDEFEKICKTNYFNITDEDYKSRIDKAIEYINKGYYKMNLNPVKFSEDLLKILKGEE